MESELDSFRVQWLRELGDAPVGEERNGGEEEEGSDPLAIAVELFLKAGRSEEKGNMVKAVRLYRRAFKLCPELEKVQTQRELRLEERVVEEARAREEEKVASSPLKRSDGVGLIQKTGPGMSSLSLPSWAVTFSSSPCVSLSPVKEGELHISLLPNELLVNVLLFCTDTPEVLEVAGKVCRLWFAASRETSLWRQACARKWPRELEALSSHVKQQLEGNWRRCFLEKPRPRCDGLYVSTNKYVRHGEQEGFFYDPIHEVHYWRLLRFYPSGEVLSLCTVEKSSAKRMHIQVAKQQREQCRRARTNRKEQSQPQQHQEKTDLGSFEMVGEAFQAKVEIVVQAASAKYTNAITGAIYSSRSGWQDRIKLESYVRTNAETGTVSSFEPELVSIYKFVKLPPQFLHYEQPE